MSIHILLPAHTLAQDSRYDTQLGKTSLFQLFSPYSSTRLGE